MFKFEASVPKIDFKCAKRIPVLKYHFKLVHKCVKKSRKISMLKNILGCLFQVFSQILLLKTFNILL